MREEVARAVLKEMADDFDNPAARDLYIELPVLFRDAVTALRYALTALDERAAMRQIVQVVADCEAREAAFVSPVDESYTDIGLFNEVTNVLYIRNRARAIVGTTEYS